MSDKLTVNPYLQVLTLDGLEDSFTLVAPTPRRGLQTLRISKPEYPNLYELFIELSQTRLDFLDVARDIDRIERDLLEQNGVLVKVREVPQRPLFFCLLDEIEALPYDLGISSLIVNPSFRIQPIDLANLTKWVTQDGLSARAESVWLTEPITEIEVGYWLNSDQSAVLSRFKAGEKPPLPIDAHLIGKLIKAKILTTLDLLEEKRQEKNEIVEAARTAHAKDKYAIVRQCLPKVQMAAMRRYYRQYVEQGFMPFDDSQSMRFYQHNEPLARFFHRNLTTLMSLVVGHEVIPSYVYAGAYVEGADLKPHVDRAQCEFSISFQVDYLPESDDHISPWALFLKHPGVDLEGAFDIRSEEFPAGNQIDDPNTAVYLKSGDGLVYRGRELVHYRYPLPKGHRSISLFFHYVSKDFQGQLN
ncbi:MAG: hypothetical protein IPN69_19945 [Acidobacteria bacterium]|nr:hypothetical protein [Acidobacteriota bacterium]